MPREHTSELDNTRAGGVAQPLKGRLPIGARI